MLYLLDANVMIRAHEDYYPIDRIPQFWTWLAALGEAGAAKVPYEIYGEIAVSTGPLHDWLTDAAISKAMLFDQKIDPANLNLVLTQGYASDLNDSEIEEIGQDPFLIGYALADVANFTVVTKEVSAPSKQRANRRVPDVCKTFGIRSINDFEFYRELNFKIGS
ncbi:DUF4411 family protein [Granulicella sp. WH15]|uniref:DUF4411 family protein n=1 Tax=Granulicella sp. WH15 TaxID=2602070 RepID=UPI001366CF3B|nr:DUF4411 family protein [Granulicella sp. WH15]QHN02616.1 DUF4411 family protein [Granulicella sp. WH15]